ncbi:MAG: flippase [Euryarchaeota archaeon]|nr:flippase [Euryarchaeota archaeon]
MNIIQRVAKNTAFLVGGNVANKALNLVLFAVIARYLGTEGFGRYSLVMAFVGLFAILLNLGLDTLAERDVAQDRRKAGAYMGNVLAIRVVLFLPVLILITISANLVGYGGETLRLFYIYAFALLATSAASIFRLILHAHEMMEYEFLVSFIDRALVLVLSLMALFLGYGLPGLIYAILAASTVDLAIYAYTAVRKVQKPSLRLDPGFWKALTVRSLPFAFMGVFYGIYSNIDVTMISIMKGDEATGVYSAAFKLVAALMFIPYAFSSSVFPLMARLSVEARGSLERAYEHSFRYLAYLAIPIGVGTTILADRIVVRVYGGGFEGSGPALQILIWAGSLMFLNSLLLNALVSINRERLNLVVAATGVILHVLLNLLLIPRYSYLGAAISTVASELAFFLMALYYLARYLYPLPLGTVFLRPLAASLAMGLFVGALRESVTIFLLIPMAAALYFFLLYLLGTLTARDRELLRELRKRG